MTSDILSRGREAIRLHDWDGALQALSTVDKQSGLEPGDIVHMGDALWWSGEPDRAVEAYQRAFTDLEKEGRKAEAARLAALLSYLAFRRQAVSVGAGWMTRAEGLLEGEPMSEGHAWVALLRLARALIVERNVDAALDLADEAIATAAQTGAQPVRSMAMSLKGIILTQNGSWKEGRALMDEAAATAMSQEMDLRTVSDVYCNTIATCRNLGDYRRAGEWTEEADRWMQAHSVGGYPGVCKVHRAELKRLRGEWSEAAEEAQHACTELERFHILDGLGFANYEIGELRRRQGDLKGAEEAFDTAYEYGHSGQPGRSLLLMDKGEVDDASQLIAKSVQRRVRLEGSTGPPLSLGFLLPAQVDIALAAGDLETAHEAIAALEELADHYEAPPWRAATLSCKGATELIEGDPERAVELLGEAWRIWQTEDMPFEAAKTRVMLARALQASGDSAAAELEFRAAKSIFERLGAAIEVRRLAEIVGTESGGRTTRALMFTDIVTSTDLIEVIGDGAWENLLAWHDRTLREVFESAGGTEVRHTGDGFFVSFDSPESAIDAAVAVQRRLEEHRREHGFSPSVRIGLHSAEVIQKRDDYAGQGVHVAARVGALAEGEEIVVSADLIDAANKLRYPISEGRVVTLKGVTDPMTIHSIDWH